MEVLTNMSSKFPKLRLGMLILLLVITSILFITQFTACIYVYDELPAPVGDLDYKVNADGETCTITGMGSYKSKTLDIPDEIDGLKVTAIADLAFKGANIEKVNFSSELKSIGLGAFDECRSLVSVGFPKGNEHITTIKDYTFRNCVKLIKISFPENLISIGREAFFGCERLVGVELPDTVTTISEGGFRQCKRLENIHIPLNIKEIKKNAFLDCYNLKSINLPEGLLSIGDNAFKGCWINLKEVVIPNTVTSIGEYAFSYCESLRKITLPQSLKAIPVGLFNGCIELEEISIPNSVESIGIASFVACFSIKEITIPASVKSVGEGAFLACFSLENIFVDEANTAWCSVNGVLYHKDMKTLHSYPSGKVEKNFAIPEGVNVIYNYAFAYNPNLEMIEIPNSVTNIGKYIILDVAYSGVSSEHSKLHTIKYDGTIANWKSVTKSPYWDVDAPEFTLYCTDGTETFERTE